ncbi:unnamed protein product [Brassica oleracea var. botrytis]|uniref:(rape) hypothetical protein n=1 Tax=Brassica napus TaxID=3708 RepID=A0A816MTL8_BRANA|nr:unnamed protein product [Brassica napus]
MHGVGDDSSMAMLSCRDRDASALIFSGHGSPVTLSRNSLGSCREASSVSAGFVLRMGVISLCWVRVASLSGLSVCIQSVVGSLGFVPGSVVGRLGFVLNDVVVFLPALAEVDQKL